ncbi:MAG: hypothetical protein ACRCXB_26675 [Aeromonadaceae bacterium]
MRDEFERFAAAHGIPWVIALAAVAITKLYSKERQTFVTIIRSLLASLLITFLVVESSNGMERGTLFVAVALAAALADFIVEAVLAAGLRIKEDPSLITRYLPWGPKK